MELILLAASVAAGGAGLGAAYWRSAHGACVCLGLAAAGVAVLAASHDAFAAAALLLVQAAVGLAALPSAALAASGASRPPRLLPAMVILGLGMILATALAAGLSDAPTRPGDPPRGGALVLVLGGLLLLSAVVGIGALSRRRGSGGPASAEAS